VFWFSPQILSHKFPILRRDECNIIIHIHNSSCKVPIVIVRFNETWIFLMDFQTILNIKFHENLSSGSLVTQWRQTDRQTDITKLKVTFLNSLTHLQVYNIYTLTIQRILITKCWNIIQRLILFMTHTCTNKHTYTYTHACERTHTHTHKLLTVKVISYLPSLYLYICVGCSPTTGSLGIFHIARYVKSDQ
jgi:hypothetical protein